MTIPVLSSGGRRNLTVRHITRFRYDQPIQHSRHCIHLRPIDDPFQNVVTYSLQTDPAVPGSTKLETTPYEVYVSKRGVCQDFANLFICLARLLGIPARYVCGYVYTGNTGIAPSRSDASHAWLQLYIPEVGWRGFDPTNGVLASFNHIRVAYGRHYRDAAPTSGTLYSSAMESMTIDVQVTEK